MERITILIADDHTMVRDSLTSVLNSVADFNVVATAESGEEAVELARQMHPDIVIIDINLPRMNGIEAAQLIRKYSPRSKSLGLSLHTEPAYANEMMKHGASGYVTKNSPGEELIKAIKEIHHHRKYICDEVKNNLADQEKPGDERHKSLNFLSETERDIIEFIKKGLSSGAIAKISSLPAETVEACRESIMKKLKLKNIASLVNYVHPLPAA